MPLASINLNARVAGDFLKRFPESLKIHAVQSGQVIDHPEFFSRITDRADQIADAMRGKQAPVVIGVPQPIDALVNLFAVWSAGHCAVNVSPDLSSGERFRVQDSVNPGLWIAADGVLTPVDGVEASASPEVALVLMTSGTAGKPKGVALGLDAIERRVDLNIAEIGSDTLANTLCPLPLFFGHGLIGNCLTPLLAGQTLHLVENPTLRDFSEFGALIDRCEISFLSSVPSMWRAILRLSPPPSRPPRRVHVGSAPLPLSLWDDIRDWCGGGEVFNTYGMTEMANWVSGGVRPSDEREGYVGKPWGGDFRVRRDSHLHTEGVGEVAIHSPTRMIGLWGEKHSGLRDDGYFLTGDIGELAPDQSLRLVGRVKNEINRAGIKVLAEEVDMLLERHPDVCEACSFGMPDELSGELVGAVVTVREGATQTSGDLITWCAQNARPHAVPHRIEIVAELQKTDRGKLARREIQMQALKRWS